MSCPVKVKPHHVAMFTKDLEATCKWWEDIFGFPKMFQNKFFLPDYGEADMAWVKVSENMYIELYDFPGLDDTCAQHYWHEYGTKHLCLWVEDEDWDTLIAYLEEKGVEITVRAEHEPEKLGKPTSTKVIFINDPNGNTIELQQSFRPGEY